jgi:hypothetical protein
MVDELVVVKSQEKEAKKGADETEGYYPADWGPAP